MMSVSFINAAPTTELTAESCGGYVLLTNNSSCIQTVYCHEITTSNQVFNMGDISPGGSISVYPTSHQARVWSETPEGEESTTKDVICTNNYTVVIDHCQTVYHCDVNVHLCLLIR